MPSFQSFQKIADTATFAGVYDKNAKDSLLWFRKEVSKMTGVTPNKIVKSEDLQPVSSALKGRMYMYGYDPKLKKTLPYYDTFPLIIMVGPAKGGFYGLNLHYLDIKRRALLFDALNDKLFRKGSSDEFDRFMLSFEKLQRGGNLRFFEPCWKHYLTNNIKTRIIKVPTNYWKAALFLPTDRFQKKARSTVWRESRKILSK